VGCRYVNGDHHEVVSERLEDLTPTGQGVRGGPWPVVDEVYALISNPP
jgi:hypothetical protein